MADVDSLSSQFVRYDQVTKSHTYRLAEGGADEFDEDYEIATIDFEPFFRGGEADFPLTPFRVSRTVASISFTAPCARSVEPRQARRR